MRRVFTFLAFASLLIGQGGRTVFNPHTNKPDFVGMGVPSPGTWCANNAAGVLTWVTCPGASGGISSIGLSLPSWYTASPNPLTVNGVIAVSPATAQTSHLVLGTCGTATSVSLCALTAGDIPSLSYQAPLTAYSTISALSGYPTTFPPVNTGNWAGTWQTYSPSSFQTAISNYSTISALTGYPSTFPPVNSGNWAGTWQSNSPSAFQPALTAYSTISGLTGYPTSFNAGQILGSTIPALASGHLQYNGTTLVWDTATYLTGNQSISVSGDCSGSGPTAISLTCSIPWAHISGTAPVWNQSTTGNAATATALAATPTGQCTGGQFATGITASGNANCSTPTGGGNMNTSTYDPAGVAKQLIGLIAKGQIDLGTTAIASGACTLFTATATGADPTSPNYDRISASFTADPTGATGYAPVTTGGLTIDAWVSAGQGNVKVCNWSTASITPGDVKINWGIYR